MSTDIGTVFTIITSDVDSATGQERPIAIGSGYRAAAATCFIIMVSC